MHRFDAAHSGFQPRNELYNSAGACQLSPVGDSRATAGPGEQGMAVDRKMSPTHEAPYRGLRVLDFGQGIASPYCAMLLGVYGADVIKVEPPEGDWSRYLGTSYGSHTALSAVYNRGKRSLCLDMKHRDGLAIAKRLAKQSDVLI